VAAVRPSPSETAAAVRAPISCTSLCDGWRGRQAPPLRADAPPTWGTAVPLAAPLNRGRTSAARHSPVICSASHPTTDASRRPKVPLPLAASPCLVLAACVVAFGAASAVRRSVVFAFQFHWGRPGCGWRDTAAGVGRGQVWGSGSVLGGGRAKSWLSDTCNASCHICATACASAPECRARLGAWLCHDDAGARSIPPTPRTLAVGFKRATTQKVVEKAPRPLRPPRGKPQGCQRRPLAMGIRR